MTYVRMAITIRCGFTPMKCPKSFFLNFPGVEVHAYVFVGGEVRQVVKSRTWIFFFFLKIQLTEV